MKSRTRTLRCCRPLSHRRTTGPRRCRSSCRRNRTTSGDRMVLSRWNRAYRATRLRHGETLIAEMAEILVQCPAQRRCGVCPRGAQVRTTLGTNRKPLSSRNARWAPRLAAFFYMRPLRPPPLRDGFFISLPGALLGLLATPAEGVQNAPQVVGVIVHPESLADYLRHAARRPQIRGVPATQRPLQQESSHRLLLAIAQARRPARHSLGSQTVGSSGAERFAPGEDRTHARTNLGRHSREAQSLS